VAATFLRQMDGSITEVEAGDVDPEGLASNGEAMVIREYLDRSAAEMRAIAEMMSKCVSIEVQ
jgi:hypothetical protein